MNILDFKFEITSESIRLMHYPQLILFEIVKEKHSEFMEQVSKEILCNGTRDPSLVTIVEHSEWEFGYSQIYYDGIFQGHLHRDFVNITFRFVPYDVKNKDYPIPYRKDFNK